MKKKFVPLLLN